MVESALMQRNIELQKECEELKRKLAKPGRKKSSEQVFRDTIMALASEGSELKSERDKLKVICSRYEAKFDYFSTAIPALKKRCLYDYPELVTMVQQLEIVLHDKNFNGAGV